MRILALLFPALSALITGIEEANDNQKVASEKEEIEKKVDAIWERGKANPQSINTNDCRQVQDFIFLLRSKGPLVPDFLYQWLKPKYQYNMKSAVGEMTDQVNRSDKDN